MSSSSAPPWFKSTVKWMEDDARTPDRELINAAWLRLYGVEKSSEKKVAEYDGGDCFASLYESGRISVNNCGLSEIRELPNGVNWSFLSRERVRKMLVDMAKRYWKSGHIRESDAITEAVVELDRL